MGYHLVVNDQEGNEYAISQGVGLGIRQHDDVMLSYGYSRVIHTDFEIEPGEFAIIVLDRQAGINHHAEARRVSAYNASLDIKVIANYTGGGIPAALSTLPAFNQKGCAVDNAVKSVFTVNGTSLATDPLTWTHDQVIDHVKLYASAGQGNTASSKDEFASVVGRYYYEGLHVVLFENIGTDTCYVTYQYNWHEFT